MAEPNSTLDYASPPKPSAARNEVAYILPMVAFLAFTWAGGTWSGFFPLSYIIKTALTAVLLAIFWKQYTKISWRYSWLGVLIGVVGVVQWVGMEKLLLHVWPHYPHLSHEAFVPDQAIASPSLRWGFIAIRWAGASLVVPVMEELFWRDYLWRSLLAPNDFHLAEVGEWDGKTFLIVAIAFGAGVHIEWMTAIVWGLLIGWLLVRTRSLGACIIAHAVTNFLLGTYVLYTHDWNFW